MANQESYKRTVAGSVGAGMGAIFNGSGRTYYILEHKTQSKFHNVGESQKIIIDQIEMGRASSCQVRWEDTPQFEMVSRRHAAIVRDGNNWELIHLSTSNPTLVNGRPIQGHYYLQSGDEIQLAAGGPRMGFIVPQGSQALTSSIKFTERLNLFRKQALKPYRNALWAMFGLLVLVTAGFLVWNLNLSHENQELLAQTENLLQKNAELDKQINLVEEQIKNNPENEELKQKVEELKQTRQQVRTQYTTIYRDNPALQQKIDALQAQIDSKIDVPVIVDPTPIPEPEPTPDPSPIVDDGAKSDIQEYYPDIYTLKIEKITVEYGGKSADPGIATSNLVVGTGFVENGRFVTARSNIQPWVYMEYINDEWRRELARFVAHGCKVIINFAAYSTRGTSAPIRFSSEQFNINTSGDTTIPITITKEFYRTTEIMGFPFTWKEYKHKTLYVPVYSGSSHNVATIHVGGAGIPIDKATSGSMKGGESITIAGYQGHQSQHSLGDATYFTTATSSVASYFITLQSTTNSWGFVGSPAFYKGEDGNYRVVGVYVGNFNGECRLVPMSRVH